jgi:hypothetical protein
VLYVGGLGNIHPNAACFSAVVPDGRDCLFRASVINISDDHPRALSRKSYSGRAPNAGCAARNNDDLTSHEIGHSYPPMQWTKS